MQPEPNPAVLAPTHVMAPAHGEQAALRSAQSCLIWGWCLVGGGCVLAFCGFIGLLAWIIGAPLVITGCVLAIITIVKGRTGGGVALLLFSLIVAPVALVFGPIVTMLIASAGTAERQESKVEEMTGDSPGASGLEME